MVYRTGNRDWLRKGVAVAAAYLFSLHLVLGAIASTQMMLSADGPQTICSDLAFGPDQPREPSDQPVHPTDCGACIVASAVAAIPNEGVIDQLRPILRIDRSPFMVADLTPNQGGRQPRSSQGPPSRA